MLLDICSKLKIRNIHPRTLWDLTTKPNVNKFILCRSIHNPYTDLCAIRYPPVALSSTSHILFITIILEIAISFAFSGLQSIPHHIEPGLRYPRVGKSVFRFEFVSSTVLLTNLSGLISGRVTNVLPDSCSCRQAVNVCFAFELTLFFISFLAFVFLLRLIVFSPPFIN